jgi:hypothetical protein
MGTIYGTIYGIRYHSFIAPLYGTIYGPTSSGGGGGGGAIELRSRWLSRYKKQKHGTLKMGHSPLETLE